MIRVNARLPKYAILEKRTCTRITPSVIILNHLDSHPITMFALDLWKDMGNIEPI